MGGYGMAAQAGLSMVGEVMAQQTKEKQRQLLQKALDEFGKIDLPSLQKVMAEEQGPSSMEGISSDPESIRAQHEALDALKNVSDSGGLTLSDRANLNRVRNQTAMSANAGRARITEDMASRGMMDSGASLAAQLAGNEGAANRASQEDMDIAGQAQHRALDALTQRGTMAGQVRGQDFSEKSRKAEAADLIARYNAEARSKAQYHNAGLPQQDYENKLNRARGMSGQLGNLAEFQGGQAQHQSQLWSGMGADVKQWLSEPQKPQQTQGQADGYSAPPLVNADGSGAGEWDDPYKPKNGGFY